MNQWNYCFHYDKKTLPLWGPKINILPLHGWHKVLFIQVFSLLCALCAVHHHSILWLCLALKIMWLLKPLALMVFFCTAMQMSRNEAGTLWTSFKGYWVGHLGDLYFLAEICSLLGSDCILGWTVYVLQQGHEPSSHKYNRKIFFILSQRSH